MLKEPVMLIEIRDELLTASAHRNYGQFVRHLERFSFNNIISHFFAPFLLICLFGYIPIIPQRVF